LIKTLKIAGDKLLPCLTPLPTEKWLSICSGYCEFNALVYEYKVELSLFLFIFICRILGKDPYFLYYHKTHYSKQCRRAEHSSLETRVNSLKYV